MGKYPLSSVELFNYVGAKSPEYARGIYRNDLGTTTCPVCRRWNFLKEDVKKILSWARYQEITGNQVNEHGFWIKKTMLCPAQCPICKAKYNLLVLPQSREPYGMQFFFSGCERPSTEDLKDVSPEYFREQENEPLEETQDVPPDDL